MPNVDTLRKIQLKKYLKLNQINPFELVWWYWLRILECAPLKVLGSIISGVNLGGLI
jgi:hypothetical protein